MLPFLSIIFFVASMSLSAMDAPSADNLALSIIADLGRSKGVTFVPNCGNGQLVRAILQNSGMKVHASDPSPANVDATRQIIEPTGKIGVYCIIDKGALSAMPYVNRFVDLIVITNLADADLANISYAEIQRVLAPDGLAFIGRATAEGAGITQTALQNWITAAAKTRSTATVSTTSGTWAVITGLELSGVDVWPMHNYDSRNSNFSKDSVAAFPWMPQAKMKPYGQSNAQRPGAGGTTVTSGGRLYEVAPDYGIEGAYGTMPPTMLRTYSVYNGELLWSRDVTSDGLGSLTTNPIKAYGRDIYLMRSSGILQLNGITGAVVGTVASVPEYPVSASNRSTNGDAGCGPYHSSIYYNFNGNGLINWDFKLNKARGGHFYKPPCGIVGTIISNGMMIHMRGTCQCGSSRYWSSNIDGPAGTFVFDRDAAPDGSDRIEKGPAWGGVAQQVIPDPNDWPTHRQNNSRSGAAAVPVATTGVRLIWNWSPSTNYVTQVSTLARDAKPDQEPTPPAVAGSFAFIGGSDGYLRCFNTVNGSQVWKFLTGGRIFATPAIANGCVYVGSADGYAYCLEAHTGRLVWRFRAAPVEMRFNLYGYLSSVWPILTGVMVDGSGNAFFAAGMQSEFGTHVYCVNALTGALKWQNNKTATVLNPQERLGVVPSGYMTIARNRMIMANSIPGIASFDIATGALDSTLLEWYTYANDNTMKTLAINGYPAEGENRGREVGIVNNTFLVKGGKWIFSDHTFRESNGYNQFESGFMTLDVSGMPKHPYCKTNYSMSVAPMWDANSYYQMAWGDHDLRGYAWSDLNTAIMAHISVRTNFPRFGTNSTDDYHQDMSKTWMPVSFFNNTTLRFNAVALTPNAVVGTYAKTAMVPPAPESVEWFVGAFNRTTGVALWEVPLPDVTTSIKGEPLHGGIAIDRSGNVIVTQYNGNVLCYGSGQAVKADGAFDIATAPVFCQTKHNVRITSTATGPHTISMVSCAGRRIASFTGSGPKSYLIDTRKYATGVYVVRMENAAVRMKKLVPIVK